MTVKEKFIRKLQNRPRRSDRNIAFWALLTAVASQLVFWSVFSYRRTNSDTRRFESSVSLLGRSAMTPGFCRWMKAHDPSNVIRSDFSGGYSAQLPREALGADAVRRPELRIREKTPRIGSFRELPSGRSPVGVVLPAVASPLRADEEVGRASVTDDRGHVLDAGNWRLPYRTAKVRGDTVLGVIFVGSLPTLTIERSCGDPELDRAALAISVTEIADREPRPRCLVIRWPEKPAGKGDKP